MTIWTSNVFWLSTSSVAVAIIATCKPIPIFREKKSACVYRCFIIGKNFIAQYMLSYACCGFYWVIIACLACSWWIVLRYTQSAFQTEMLTFDNSISCFNSSWMSEGITWHTDSNASKTAVSSLQEAEHSSECWPFLWLQALLIHHIVDHFGRRQISGLHTATCFQYGFSLQT